MNWTDEGYLLSKNNFDENSLIIETFTLQHGKYSGIVYGGLSRKQKKFFQIGNKILLNLKSKGENKIGYFTIELIKAISPQFFDDKRKSICILAASSILKILLPERQINKKIYNSFEEFLNKLKNNDWIKLYIFWELSLMYELGYSLNFNDIDNSKSNIFLNEKNYKIPELITNKDNIKISNDHIKEALSFNKNLLMDSIITPNKLKLPLSRNVLEKYYI